MKFNTLNATFNVFNVTEIYVSHSVGVHATYGNLRRSFVIGQVMRGATTAAGCLCRGVHGATAEYGELPAGSSQLHSMTLAAPGRGELRLRQLKLTEGHRMMTAPVSCRRLG